MLSEKGSQIHPTEHPHNNPQQQYQALDNFHQFSIWRQNRTPNSSREPELWRQHGYCKTKQIVAGLCIPSKTTPLFHGGRFNRRYKRTFETTANQNRRKNPWKMKVRHPLMYRTSAGRQVDITPKGTTDVGDFAVCQRMASWRWRKNNWRSSKQPLSDLWYLNNMKDA